MASLIKYIYFILIIIFGFTNFSLAAQWQHSVSHNGIAYFAFSSPRTIERFDMGSETWLEPLTLTSSPTALTVDSDAIYVSYGRSTVRIEHDGSGETHLENTTSDATGLAVAHDYLFIITQQKDITSVNKHTGEMIDRQEFFYNMRGISVAPTINRFFGRNTGVSPSDIMYVEFNADGTLYLQDDSPHHGDYPGASQTWVFPNEAQVVDDAGIVYATNDLRYARSFGGSLDDLSFYGDLPIVLRGATLFSYSNTLNETGRYTMSVPPEKIFVDNETVYAFYDGTTELINVVSVPIDLLSPQLPGEPVDPAGLAYEPDSIVLGNDRTVYLLNCGHLSIFRWSIESRSYLETIPLIESPLFMAYSGTTNRLYLAYPTGRMTQIKLGESVNEEPFANSPQRPLGLATADEFVFVCDPSGAWVSHFTYHPNGSLISQVDWNYWSQEYIWSTVNGKMYFLRDDTSPNDILWEDIDEDGTIGAKDDSPFHSSYGMTHPIRVSPDGSVVLLGSGQVHDAISLDLIDTLSRSIDDAAWFGLKLFTLHNENSFSVIQEWLPSYAPGSSFLVPGTPLRLFALEEELLIITSVEGIPTFTIQTPNYEDFDEDGIPDHLDNCPKVNNPLQIDTDGDHIGDACNDDYDADSDEWADYIDNCPDTANTDQQDSDSSGIGDACNDAVDSDGDEWDFPDNCSAIPNPLQEDTYPPLGNGIGDACDCEGDFMCDGDVDGSDASVFKFHFGRSPSLYQCSSLDTCRGDFSCDGDVDGTDAVLFKQDFGRSQFSNPCPTCTQGVPWCVYP